MIAFARTYWFTWGFLIFAALFTGVHSVREIFFSGVIASLLSASATRGYEKLGYRYAPLLGAVLGIVWSSLMLLYVRWFGSADDYVIASWRLGTTMAIHVAGFAGAGLLTALVTKHSLGRSLAAGTILSCAMTAIPYGFIAWVDARLAGPIEIIALVSADVAPNEVPVRRPGTDVAKISDEEMALLKEKWLVTKGQSEFEVIDEQGRRYWPLWRKTFVYPGNPSQETRRLFVLIPPDFSETGRWSLPLTSNPKGVSIVQFKYRPGSGFYTKTLLGRPPTQNISCEINFNAPKNSTNIETQGITATIKIKRLSPIGDFYSDDPIKSNLALQFPPLIDKADEKIEPDLKTKKRPSFDDKVGQ
ncbi:MAG: hypothetical protein JHC77_04015 [Opitutales bacterium]|nr:hypothetical protein [Opitutales bacterium]